MGALCGPRNRFDRAREENGRADGGRGQYAIGTFTADSVFQQIGMGFGPNSETPVLNGYQLRTATVPEPASPGLLALGLLARRFGRR